MEKHGFTLVELMVAVVITAILATVCVPKLSEMAVRARAGEISPAAMTYTKLQSAYLYEHKAFGSWRKIGYEAPGGKKAKTDTFKYSKGDVTTSIKGRNLSSTLGGDGLVAWQAENRVGLGKCHIGNKWQIKVVATSDTEIEYRPVIVASNTSAGCLSLAKDWGNFELQASLVTAPHNYAGKDPASSGSGSTPGNPTTPDDGIIVAGGPSSPSTPSNDGDKAGSSSSAKAASSSSHTQVASKFVDEEEDWEEEDDGSCGVMYTSAGNRCPPSWCKLNGNVARNHGGWGKSGHKWNECYTARQDLISEAADQGLLDCKNSKNCKVVNPSSSITIKGNKLSVAGEESFEDASSGSSDPIVYNGKGRENAEKALGDKVMCAENKNDNACGSWRLASECTYPSKDYSTCNGW